MRDELKARISAVEHIQKEFGHEIREIKKELARLAKLVEGRAKVKVMHPQESSPSPIHPCLRFCQHPSPQPGILIANNKACRSNLQPPMHTLETTFVLTKASLFNNPSSSSKNHLKGTKACSNKI